MAYQRPLMNTDSYVMFGLEADFGVDTAMDTPAELDRFAMIETIQPLTPKPEYEHIKIVNGKRTTFKSVVTKMTYEGSFTWIVQDALDCMILLWATFGGYVREATPTTPFYHRFRPLNGLNNSGLESNEATVVALDAHTGATSETQTGKRFNKSLAFGFWTGLAVNSGDDIMRFGIGVKIIETTFTFEEGKSLRAESTVRALDVTDPDSAPPSLPATVSTRTPFVASSGSIKLYPAATVVAYAKILSGTIVISHNSENDHYVGQVKPSDIIDGSFEATITLKLRPYWDSVQRFLPDMLKTIVNDTLYDLWIPEAEIQFDSIEDSSTSELVFICQNMTPEYALTRGEDKAMELEVTYTAQVCYASYKTTEGAGNLNTDTYF